MVASWNHSSPESRTRTRQLAFQKKLIFRVEFTDAPELRDLPQIELPAEIALLAKRKLLELPLSQRPETSLVAQAPSTGRRGRGCASENRLPIPRCQDGRPRIFGEPASPQFIILSPFQTIAVGLQTRMGAERKKTFKPRIG